MPLPPKFWFQWQRLKKVFASSLGAQESGPTSTVRMCPHCRALIDRDAKVCPLCGEATGPVRARGGSSTPGRIMGVIPIPTTASSAIVVANLVLYAISWYMTQNSASAQLYGATSMGGISGEVLMRLGAKSPYILAGQWWRLVTAMFLHAGLLHIGMNLWCLVDLGPEVESLFSGGINNMFAATRFSLGQRIVKGARRKAGALVWVKRGERARCRNGDCNY